MACTSSALTARGSAYGAVRRCRPPPVPVRPQHVHSIRAPAGVQRCRPVEAASTPAAVTARAPDEPSEAATTAVVSSIVGAAIGLAFMINSWFVAAALAALVTSFWVLQQAGQYMARLWQVDRIRTRTKQVR